MRVGKYTGEINFVIRDIDTGEVKEEFKSFTSARNYLAGMNFGLQNYYEIYDCRKKKVVCRIERNLDRGYRAIKEDYKE